MKFCKVYPTGGSQGRKIEGTERGVVRETNKRKNDGDDDIAVGMAAGGAMGPRLCLSRICGEEFEYRRLIEWQVSGGREDSKISIS